MAPPRDEVMRTDEARSFCRRQFIRLVAAGIASVGLTLQARPGAATRRRRRSGWLGGTLHQHKDNPTAHPGHPVHRIAR